MIIAILSNLKYFSICNIKNEVGEIWYFKSFRTIFDCVIAPLKRVRKRMITDKIQGGKRRKVEDFTMRLTNPNKRNLLHLQPHHIFFYNSML